jgi:hypothetical protein
VYQQQQERSACQRSSTDSSKLGPQATEGNLSNPADQRIQDMILHPNLVTEIIREQNKVLESKGLSSSSA